MSTSNIDQRGFPLEQIVVRLRELASAVTQGPDAVRRETSMRAPAEPERDAALVLSRAATEIEQLHKLMADAWEAWDGDQDARVGKLLRAMLDDDFRRTYRPDLYMHNTEAKGPRSGPA